MTRARPVHRLSRHDPHANGWTDEQIAELRKLVGEGLSAAQIAKAMAKLRPGLTRNGVIGRVVRAGLQLAANNGGAVKRYEPKQPKRLGSAPKPIAAPSAKPRNRNVERTREKVVTIVAPSPAEAVRANAFDILRSSSPLSLMKRKANQCAWPVGEPPRPAEQLCCGAPVASAAAGAPPYCDAHMALRKGKQVAPVKIGSAP